MDNLSWSWLAKRNALFGSAVLVAVLAFIFLTANEAKAAAPLGYLDGVSQLGVISGWAIDPDSAGRHIEVHAYFDGPAGKSKNVTGSSTSYARCDVRYLQDVDDCGFHYGFDIQVPANLQDGREHKVYVYAIDANFANFGEGSWAKTGASTLLGGSPMSFRIGLSTNSPRHARGALVQDSGTIYFIGEQLRYPFPNAEVFLSWGVKFNQVVPANSGDLAMAIGPVVQMKTGSNANIGSNRKPLGQFDRINNGYAEGWALDMDASTSPLQVHVYADGPAGVGKLLGSNLTEDARTDVNSAYSVHGLHGFRIDLYAFQEITLGAQHMIYVYALDANDTSGQSNVLLSGSPLPFQYGNANPNPTPVPPPSPNAPSIKITSPVSGEYVAGSSVYISYTVTNAADLVNPQIEFAFTDQSGVTLFPQRVNYSEYPNGVYWFAGSISDPSLDYLYYFGKMRLTAYLYSNGQLVASDGIDGDIEIKRKSPGTTLDIVTEALPPGSPDAAYSALLQATGGTAPYKWQILATDHLCCVVGLVESTGELKSTGNGLDAGEYQYIIKVTDASGAVAVKQFYWGVRSVATVKDRDMVRAGDILSIYIALIEYEKEYGEFPKGSKLNLSGKGLGSQGWVTASNSLTYHPGVPTPPKADGPCSASQNAYIYTRTSSDDFTLTFCIGAASEGVKAGLNTITADGLK